MANIETITVGNTTFDVLGSGYAVSEEYSTTESVVGTWIDGKSIMQKTISCGALPNNTTKTVDLTDLNIDLIISLSGFAYNNSYIYTIPKISTGSNSLEIWFDRSTKKLNLRTTTNQSSYANSYITLKYTKTTDV